MADKPILFSAPMVKALLDGRKTQTRRALKMPDGGFDALFHDDGGWFTGDSLTGEREHRLPVRYAAGDRLWCRETCRAEELPDSALDGVRFLADEAFIPIENSQEASERWVDLYHYGKRKKRGATVPPIHMPRWASRLTLIVTDVRVQRVQEISRDDAIAEGLIQPPHAPALAKEMGCDWGFDGDTRHGSPVSAYAALWNSINGPGAWEANPWVAAYTFTVHRSNIDRMELERADA